MAGTALPYPIVESDVFDPTKVFGQTFGRMLAVRLARQWSSCQDALYRARGFRRFAVRLDQLAYGLSSTRTEDMIAASATKIATGLVELVFTIAVLWFGKVIVKWWNAPDQEEFRGKLKSDFQEIMGDHEDRLEDMLVTKLKDVLASTEFKDILAAALDAHAARAAAARAAAAPAAAAPAAAAPAAAAPAAAAPAAADG